MECGIPKDTFYHSTPAEINVMIDAYQKRTQSRYDTMEQMAWLIGMYDMCAIGSAFSKKVKYPKSPTEEKKKDIHEIAKRTDKDETEIRQELLYMQMRVLEANSHIAALDERLQKEAETDGE